jgi:mono/diheme cytochrome c family protein
MTWARFAALPAFELCSMKPLKPILLATLILLVAWAAIRILLIAVVRPANTVVAESSAPKKAANEASSPGKQLFAANCAACHALDKALTGPALRGFTARGPWADRKEIYKWVKNPAAYIAKDPYTKGLQQQYGALMTPFPSLAEKEIDLIVGFIEGK